MKNIRFCDNISRWGTDWTYKNELKDTIKNELIKISKTEGTIYRKEWFTDGNSKNISVYKFENGKIKLREDIKSKIIKSASEKLINLKALSDEKAKNLKFQVVKYYTETEIIQMKK